MKQALVPALAALAALSCSHPTPAPPPPPTGTARCELDLTATGLFSPSGNGASAAVVKQSSQLIGGEGATGRLGDVLLQNDKIRVIIEQPGRSIGPILSGGHIVDADIQRPSGEPGQDGWGRINLMYALGRLSSIEKVEILQDGSSGGPAVVASTGHDSPNDVLNIKMLLMNQAGLDIDFVVDASKPMPLRSTTYYVLSPGESRVRTLTAFCNDGTTAQPMPLIEFMDMGTDELFFPGSCMNGLGAAPVELTSGCVVQTPGWYASQDRGVAYGMQPYKIGDAKTPVTANAIIGYGGVVAAVVDGQSLQGVLSWADSTAATRPGTLLVRPGGQKTYLNDFFVGRDIASVSSPILKSIGVATGHIDVSAPAGARVTVLDTAGTMQTLLEMDATGQSSVDLPAGDYSLSAATEGRLIGPAAQVTVTAGGTQQLALTLAPARTLHVSVTDIGGAPSPAKVTVMCAGGTCPFNAATWKQHMLIDAPAGGAAAIGYVPVSGLLDVTVPPGQYIVFVSRGPEYSLWPDTTGQSVDLTTADGQVTAQIGRIVDTTGWLSSDLHVHAVNSSDSSVQNARRVANFIAEGVNVLLSTDHEVITDFAPIITELNADSVITSMIGEEVTTFSHGHFNAFPLKRDPSKPYGGAFDHAGGEDGPTLRMPQLYDGVHSQFPGSVLQLNHPRGTGGGVLTLLQVDTATLATHGDPKTFDMAAAPDATATDTKLFGPGFDSIETMNGTSPNYGVLNDWMTFLSRGTVRTATGVSDTHGSYGSTGGYARTYAQVATFTPAAFADAIRAHHAFVSNTPFLKVTANGKGIGDTVSVASGGEVDITVDIQGPDWMQLDRVELYSYAAGREATNGDTNSDWPDARILQKHDLTALTIEAVPGTANLRRVHQVEHFTVNPTADTWYVVMARGLTGRNMWPLHEDRPVAYSNAILVDADGSGAYDDYPLNPGQPLSAPPKGQTWHPIVPTVAQMEQAIWTLVYEDHHK
jgi:hypothetical protein